MDLKRLKQIIDAYGGNLQRWPQAERQAAQTLLETSAMARQWQREALMLDTLLDNVAVVAPSAELKTRIFASAQAFSREMDIWQWLVQWLWGTTWTQHVWRPVFALGLPIFFGIGLGLSISYQQIQLDESTVVVQSEFADVLYPDQQNLTEWAKWL
ncbi:MAG: hypothetical protein BWK79_00240 [Beggiatoa sp. IS2]|nr:MAG: hypothetical protein BWK79_00240 [Beggiatoa sp. IS2]